MDKAKRQRQLARLYRESGGLCAICKEPTILCSEPRGGRASPRMAVRFRTGSSYGKPGRTRLRILACRQCAQERSDQITLSQPVEELHRRSGRYPTEFYEAVQDCSSTAEPSAHNGEVGGSNPPGPTNATVAQLVERPICNGEDSGSKPDGGTNFALLAQRIEHEDSTLGAGGSNPSERTSNLISD